MYTKKEYVHRVWSRRNDSMTAERSGDTGFKLSLCSEYEELEGRKEVSQVL